MSLRPLVTSCFVVALTTILAACSPEARTPAVPELAPGVWTQIAGAGDTLCADGSEFSFFARPGSVNRVAVHFMGGGACWNAETCGDPAPAEDESIAFYDDHVAATPERLATEADGSGLLDLANARNPFANWYQVLIPYCTGDLHLGDATVAYEPGVTVHHRGAVNARAALDWIDSRFEAPERIFVSGCSAGAYASIFWTPLLREAHPHAALAQLGDSGAGVVTEDFLAGGFRGWNVAAALPDFVPGSEPADLQRIDALEQMYRSVGAAYPNVALSQYDTLFDGVQTFFYAEMLGVEPDPELVLAWSELMQDSLDGLEAEVANFDSYVANYDFGPRGTPHCIVNGDDLYTVVTNGVPFLDWLQAVAGGGEARKVRPVP